MTAIIREKKHGKTPLKSYNVNLVVPKKEVDLGLLKPGQSKHLFESKESGILDTKRTKSSKYSKVPSVRFPDESSYLMKDFKSPVRSLRQISKSVSKKSSPCYL